MKVKKSGAEEESNQHDEQHTLKNKPSCSLLIEAAGFTFQITPMMEKVKRYGKGNARNQHSKLWTE